MGTNRPSDVTMHRRDIPHGHFDVLNRFCWALNTISQDKHNPDSPTYGLIRGNTDLCVPVWKLEADKWVLFKHRTYNAPAIFITVTGMRNISRAAQFSESLVVRVLYDLSILSVNTSKPDCMGKNGQFINPLPDSLRPAGLNQLVWGYVVEERRALGRFKRQQDI